MAHTDDFKKYDVPTESALTWEVITARGVATGDVMTLWVNACALSMSVEAVKFNGQMLHDNLVRSGYPDKAVEILIEYDMLLGYIRRDVAEIIKFLSRRGFHFPDLSPEDFDGYLK